MENIETTNVEEPQTQVSDEATEPKTFTQEEVNAITGDRVKREQAKHEKLLAEERAKTEQVTAELNELKKQQEEKQLSKLTNEERLQKKLEKLEKDNADLLAKQKRAEMTAEVRQELSKDGYTVTDGILSLIVTDDVESTSNNMKVFKEYTDGLKEQWETERSKGVTPKASTNTGKTVVTREQFDRMTYAEKAKLAQENPHLFNKLTGVE